MTLRAKQPQAPYLVSVHPVEQIISSQLMLYRNSKYFLRRLHQNLDAHQALKSQLSHGRAQTSFTVRSSTTFAMMYWTQTTGLRILVVLKNPPCDRTISEASWVVHSFFLTLEKAKVGMTDMITLSSSSLTRVCVCGCRKPD